MWKSIGISLLALATVGVYGQVSKMIVITELGGLSNLSRIALAVYNLQRLA
jgi:hypothetical protein